jgi:vacuolar-type H+-ATPase subunit E/Vma4
MALSDLISRLEQEAQTRVLAIQQEADARVRAIDAANEQAVTEMTARHLHRERTERQIVQQRELAQARQRARARELAARRAQITRILERARAIVPEVAASAPYLDALPSHLEEALAFLEGLQPRARCQAAFVSVLQTTIARHAGAELVIDESVGPGVVVEARDGSVVVDNTLAARLARMEASLAIELSRKLDDASQ